MHPVLQQVTERVEQRLREDARCLGLYLWGSSGKGTDDAYSDLDLGVVIRDADYEAVRQEFRRLCEAVCGPLQVWLPEGEQEGFCNYAFLFEAGTDLLLADFSIMSGAFLARAGAARIDRIRFDREGVLAEAAARPHVSSYAPDRLLPTIDEYWVYAYINGKYWKRSDLFKLLYLQEVLFRIHVRLLRALHPTADWSWWPINLRHLPPQHQEEMRVYFGLRELTEIGRSLNSRLDLFARDAREASKAWGLEYPDALEQSVRRHLRRMGLPVAVAE
jgi:hypothetical protein